MQKSESQQVIEYIAQHPGIDNLKIAEELKLNRTRVASITTKLFKAGRLTREMLSLKKGAKFKYIISEDTPKEKPKSAPMQKTKQVADYSVPLTLLVNTLASAIADQIMRQIHVKLAGHVADVIDQVAKQDKGNTPTIQEMAKRVVNATSPLRLRLPSLLIMGLLPSQAGIISEEFKECFDIRFWKDESMEMLKHTAAGADYVVAFTSKISHSAEEMMKSKNIKIIRSPGGMTTLRAKLMELYVQHMDKQQAA
jgi:hypothetical protein